jgi:hypothetical protein
MNAAAIQTIWQAILDSERSDDLSFIDALKRSLMARPDRSDRPGATTEPLRTPDGYMPSVTLPLLARP